MTVTAADNRGYPYIQYQHSIMSLQTILIDFTLNDSKEVELCDEKIIVMFNRQMEDMGTLTEESRHKGVSE